MLPFQIVLSSPSKQVLHETPPLPWKTLFDWLFNLQKKSWRINKFFVVFRSSQYCKNNGATPIRVGRSTGSFTINFSNFCSNIWCVQFVCFIAVSYTLTHKNTNILSIPAQPVTMAWTSIVQVTVERYWQEANLGYFTEVSFTVIYIN